MDEKPIHINDECWGFIKNLLHAISDTTIRSLYTEIIALETVILGMKKSRPHQAVAIDQCLAIARDSEDIKREADKRVQSVLKIVNALDQSNREQVLPDLVRLCTQIAREN